MRYLLLLIIVITLWMLMQEFLFQDRSDEGLRTFREKLGDLKWRLHYVFGLLAILIIIIMLVRFVIKYFELG